MNPATVDLKDRLIESAYGVGVFATDLFIGLMPEDPDDCISMMDSSSMAPELNYELDEPSVQVLVRGAKGNYLTAYTKAQEVHAALHGITNTVINGTRYILVAADVSPMYIGQDQSERPMFSINFSVQRTTN